MAYTPKIGTLGYILSPDKKEVLMIHRNAREDDDHLGKYNGLGGKMESDEDIACCMTREIYEESGLECTQLQLRGTLNWTGFGPKKEFWLGFIFLITQFKGTSHTSNNEGDLEWIKLNKLNDLPMWEGDRLFLPLVFDNNPLPFHGYMSYDNDKLLDWKYTRI
ncbi:8-oxo-dGTP diphosphatase [Simkania negevensis]|uniref:8-oxo-dGTP diphosphatase n=1 Tax=Simkania negevensis TaxID=83561 RepID=A0ABS3APL6_9BACT|nr:8-oxo-dGTP diphosphatase [Simkania negevensis]